MWTKKQIIYALLLNMVPIILGIIFWDKIPELLPAHWNIKGEVDWYLPKLYWILMPLGIALFMFGGILLMPLIDPKKNYELFKNALFNILFISNAFIIFIFMMITLYSSNETGIIKMVCYGTVLLMMLVGNYLGKLRPSYFVGIRTPWTLSDDEVWVKTHRFSGYWWMLFSLFALIILPFTGNQIFTFFIGYIAILITVSFLYSYFIYRKLRKS